MSFEEIARRLGVTRSTALRIYVRGMEKLLRRHRRTLDMMRDMAAARKHEQSPSLVHAMRDAARGREGPNDAV